MSYCTQATRYLVYGANKLNWHEGMKHHTVGTLLVNTIVKVKTINGYYGKLMNCLNCTSEKGHMGHIFRTLLEVRVKQLRSCK